jgi:outer membrane biogenesis lipoprotein LolB
MKDLRHTVKNKFAGLFLLLLAVATLVMSGCASTEPGNMSSRPWNAPKSWENGLPATMMEGR